MSTVYHTCPVCGHRSTSQVEITNCTNQEKIRFIPAGEAVLVLVPPAFGVNEPGEWKQGRITKVEFDRRVHTPRYTVVLDLTREERLKQGRSRPLTPIFSPSIQLLAPASA